MRSALHIPLVFLIIPSSSLAFTTVSSSVGVGPKNLHTLIPPQHHCQHLINPSSNAAARTLFASFNNDEDTDDHIIEPEILHKSNLSSPKSASSALTTKELKNHGVHPALKHLWKSVRTSFSKHQKKTMTVLAAAIIMASVVFSPLQEALAAPSGGRMGGSFGGSNRQSSSRTYSSPSNSYGSGFRQGYSTGYYSRPSVTIGPTYGYGYGYSPLVPYARPGVAVVRTGPSIIDVFVLGVFAFVVFSTFAPFAGAGSGTSSSIDSVLGPGVTVAQVSIAMNVPRRNDPSSILSYLDRLSRTASTDSRVGISNLVNQVAIELLRQKRSIFGAKTEYKHFRNESEASRHFNSLGIKERGKFEREGTNKFGGVDYAARSGDARLQSDTFSPQATSAVITLLISIDGDQTKLPQINNISDVERALTRLATDVKVDDCLRSAEVLWTPEDKNDVLSERDIIVDYPSLRSV